LLKSAYHSIVNIRMANTPSILYRVLILFYFLHLEI